MELIHIANATFSSSRIKSKQLTSLENLASKNKTYRIVKEHVMRSRSAPRKNSCVFSGQNGEWWSQPGSNRRPSGCKPDALPAELWPQAPEHLVAALRPDATLLRDR